MLADGFFDDDADFIIDDGFGEVVENAHFCGFDSAFDGAVAGDDDHDDVRGAAADIAEKFGGFYAGHVDVGEEDFDLAVFQEGIGVFRYVAGAEIVTLAAEELGEGLEDDAILVEDEDARLMGRVGLEHDGSSSMFRECNACRFLASAKLGVDGKRQLEFFGG